MQKVLKGAVIGSAPYLNTISDYTIRVDFVSLVPVAADSGRRVLLIVVVVKPATRLIQ
jgi:hypothetical protein